jgi:hypothetical protein
MVRDAGLHDADAIELKEQQARSHEEEEQIERLRTERCWPETRIGRRRKATQTATLRPG